MGSGMLVYTCHLSTGETGRRTTILGWMVRLSLNEGGGEQLEALLLGC